MEQMEKLCDKYNTLGKELIRLTDDFFECGELSEGDTLKISAFAEDIILTGAWLHDRCNGKKRKDRDSIQKKIRKILGFLG